ncbi:MAG: hypothetical protein OHK0032_18230 [Thermodesulfovibrionales bacterium]
MGSRRLLYGKNVTEICLSSGLAMLLLVACSRQPVYPAPQVEGSAVVIDAKALNPEMPEFYTYRYRNKNINFFVVKINGRVLSFLDACANCYPKKLGYRFEDGHIVCRACNVRYSVSEVEKGFGGCFPIHIQGHLQDGKYLIPISVLEGMADKF